MSINSRIKNVFDELEKQGFKKTQISEATSISYSSIFDMQKEGHPVNARNLKLLNLVFYVNLDYLLKGKGKMFNKKQQYSDKLQNLYNTLDPKHQKYALRILEEIKIMQDDDNEY